MARADTVKFADDSGFHGLKPFLESTSKTGKIIWSIILLFAFALMIRGVVATVAQYAGQPTMTEVSFFAKSQFPTLLFCDTLWGDEKRMRGINMTQTDFEVLKRIYPVMQGPEPWSNKHDQFIDKFGDHDFDNLTLSIVHDPTDILTIKDTGLLGNVTLSKWNTFYGPCVKLKNNITVTKLGADKVVVILDVASTKPPFGIAEKMRMRTIAVGDDTESRYGDHATVLAPGVNYWIAIRTTMVTSLTTGRQR